MSRDLGHVSDIATSARRIAGFVSQVTQDEFMADILRQSGVLYQLTIIGEACRRISAEFRDANPAVNWAAIIGLRNRIVHEYDDVDLEVVWRVATEQLPVLVSTLNALLPDGEE